MLIVRCLLYHRFSKTSLLHFLTEILLRFSRFRLMGFYQLRFWFFSINHPLRLTFFLCHLGWPRSDSLSVVWNRPKNLKTRFFCLLIVINPYVRIGEQSPTYIKYPSFIRFTYIFPPIRKRNITIISAIQGIIITNIIFIRIPFYLVK